MNSNSKIIKILPYFISVVIHSVIILYAWQTVKSASFNVIESPTSLEIVSLAPQSEITGERKLLSEQNKNTDNLSHIPTFQDSRISSDEIFIPENTVEKNPYSQTNHEKEIVKKVHFKENATTNNLENKQQDLSSQSSKTYLGAVYNPHPVMIHNPAPIYPLVARKKGWEGEVLLKLLISSKGNAENVEIEKSSGFDALDNSALQEIKKWKFMPQERNGAKEISWATIPVRFKLSN